MRQPSSRLFEGSFGSNGLLAPGMPQADGEEPHSDQTGIILGPRGQVMPMATARSFANVAVLTDYSDEGDDGPVGL